MRRTPKEEHHARLERGRVLKSTKTKRAEIRRLRRLKSMQDEARRTGLAQLIVDAACAPSTREKIDHILWKAMDLLGLTLDERCGRKYPYVPVPQIAWDGQECREYIHMPGVPRALAAKVLGPRLANLKATEAGEGR